MLNLSILLVLNKEHKLFLNNSLSVHFESRNIFYDNFNTNESFYDFLLAQQDKSKKIINKKISYGCGFKQYLQNFQQNFDYEDVHKFVFFTNKNSKYIFYQFNSYLESTHQQKNK